MFSGSIGRRRECSNIVKGLRELFLVFAFFSREGEIC